MQFLEPIPDHQSNAERRTSFPLNTCDLRKDKADYGYKDWYFCLAICPCSSPELSSPLWPPRGKAAAQPPSHPAACTLTPRQLCLEVRWTLKSLSLRSPWRRQLPVNASRTSPSACWHVRSFLPPGLLGSRHTVSVRLWSVVRSFWPGGDQSASDRLFLPNLIQ